MIGRSGLTVGPARGRAASAVVGGVALAVLLAGCGSGGQASPSPITTGSSPTSTTRTAVGGATAGNTSGGGATEGSTSAAGEQSVQDIQTSVNDAQSLLDGLDQDFAGDAADVGN